jgi:branched-chain amino acid transport system substrate-binding protein
MKKKLIIGICALIVLICFKNITGNTNSNSEHVIKIGVTAPLTGDLAFIGEGFKNSLLLAQKERKNTKYKYELIFQDDSFNSSRGVTAALKLINTDKVDVVVSFGSSVGNAVSPIAEKSHIPHVNAIASDPQVALGEYNFVHWTPPESEARMFLEEMKKRGIKRIVLFEQNQAGVIAGTNAIKKFAPEYGVTIVEDKKFNEDEKDFRTLISEVKNSKAGLYALEAMSPSLEVLAKQIRSAGIKTPFSSIESFEYTQQASLFEGDWYIFASDPTQEFVNLYTKEYGKAPVVGSPNGFDIYNFIVDSAEKSDSPTSESIKNNLYLIQNQKSANGIVSIDKDGIVVSSPTLRMIKDGKPVTIKP